MIYPSDLIQLTESWESLAKQVSPTDDYACAIKACIDDVNYLLRKSEEEERLNRNIFENQEVERFMAYLEDLKEA